MAIGVRSDQRTFLLLGAATVAGAVLIAFSAFAYVSYQHAVDQRSSSRSVIIAEEDLLAALLDAETGGRGFIITADPGFLDPYNAARDRVQALMADLRRRLEDQGELQPQRDQLPALSEARIAALAEGIALVEAGRTAEADDAIASRRGKELMDQLRTILGQVRSREEVLLARYSDDADNWAAGLAGALATLGILSSLLLAYLYLAVWRARDREVLRTSNAAKDEFIGMVSHELRTPITTIMGNAALLRRPELAADVRRESIEAIEADATRLNRVVENMLLLSRLESGRLPMLEPLLLQHLLPRVARLHRRLHPGRKVEVVVDAHLPPVLADESYVEQVVLNFLSNAEKYGHAEEPIEVTAELRGEEAVVATADRGAGIDPRELERVFEPFYRSESASITAPGLGLGLPVCRRLVEAQGGRTWAEARPGGGTVFAFTLPTVSAEEDEDA